MSQKKVTAKDGRKGRAEGGRKLTPEQEQQIEADAESFKADAIAYAQTAYDAALAHFEKHYNDPFALSRLAVVFGEPIEDGRPRLS